MSLDLAKYRALFLEEGNEHLAELSRALLGLEKDVRSAEAIDVAFRMAHSIKGMAASLGYDSISEVAHRFEDRMARYRAAGRVDAGGIGVLFQGLDGLERMLERVRESGGAPPAEPLLAAALAASDPDAVPEVEPAKKSAPALTPAPRAATAAPAPSPSVRVRTDALDRILSSVGEVILSASQLRSAAGGSPVAAPAQFSGGLDRMERVVGELQRRALELRTTPLLRVMEPLPRVARELAQRLGKRVEVELAGAELELDRSILDRLGDPLVHLLRNAVDHGIEPAEERRRAGKSPTGRIRIEARRDRDTIRVAVRDDGAGIDLDAVRARAVAAGFVHGDLAEDLPAEEIAALVFRPGLSTATEISDVSGRGVGMDAVKATIESLGGRVELESRRGLGITTTLVVPITAAIQRVLLLGIAGETVAVPISKVERIVEVAASAIERSARESFALVDDEPVLVIDLAERLGLPAPAPRPAVPLVLAEVRDARVALRVEDLEGQGEIYVKPVPELLASLRGLAGLTVLGDGRPIFLLDLNHLV